MGVLYSTMFCVLLLKCNLPGKGTEKLVPCKKTRPCSLHSFRASLDEISNREHVPFNGMAQTIPSFSSLNVHFTVITFAISSAHKQILVQSSWKARSKYFLHLQTNICIQKTFLPYFKILDQIVTNKSCFRCIISITFHSKFSVDLQHVRTHSVIKDLNSSV